MSKRTAAQKNALACCCRVKASLCKVERLLRRGSCLDWEDASAELAGVSFIAKRLYENVSAESDRANEKEWSR